jgi:hypothetical protein
MQQTYTAIFLDAAPPQKLVFLALAGAVVAMGAITLSRMRRPPEPPSRLIVALRLAGPALGLICAALNGLHMMQTTLRLPIAPTAKMLAPGFLEMAALVEAGAFAGLVAVVLNWVLEARFCRRAVTAT